MEVIGYDSVGNVRVVIDGIEWSVPQDESHPFWRRILEWGGVIPAYVPPAETVPNLEPDQFWFVLRVSDYEDDLIAWLEILRANDPVSWAAASSKLQYAKFFERDHPFVEAAREALDIPSEQLDALWQYGAAS